jgi:hypothetical protein
MMPIRLSSVFFAAACVAGGAAAQDLGDLVVAQVEAALGDTTRFAAGELSAERVVKGAPYCADAVHENVQWLPDPAGGAPNRIVHSQTSRLCRDAEGRTRQEVDRQGRRIVYLRDPVAREGWVLNPETKTATRLRSLHGGLHAAEAAIDESAWREYAERMREWTRNFRFDLRNHAAQPPQAPPPPAPPTPPTPPTPALVGRADNETVVVRVDSPMRTIAAPPAVAWRAQAFAPRGAGTVQPLPAKEIEGLRANGERTTWTIEAGRVGNEKPIQIVREVWTAPELMLTVSSRDFDPRSGEVNYRLQNLRRGEPDPALMRVPADYKARPGAKGASSATG